MGLAKNSIGSLANSDGSSIASDNAQQRPVPRTAWKRIVRFAFHVLVLYLVVRFSRDDLPDWLCSKTLGKIYYPAAGANPLKLYFSHLLAFSAIPAFVAGIAINARLKDGVARFVWIVPVAILILNFVFRGPGVYPTMLWQSDFGTALHHFFGAISFDGLGNTAASVASWRGFLQAYTQMRYTAPAYAGAAYGAGAAIGMSAWCRGLQRSFEQF